MANAHAVGGADFHRVALDVKPVMQELVPREPLRQPARSHELMRAYWAR